jgi:hypothetical protein
VAARRRSLVDHDDSEILRHPPAGTTPIMDAALPARIPIRTRAVAAAEHGRRALDKLLGAPA